MDDRTCYECETLNGRTFTLDEAEGMIPYHPNCLIDGQTLVFTSAGWRQIRTVKVGDLVLTHLGKFCRVTQTHQTPSQTPDVVKLHVNIPDEGARGTSKHLTLTANHPVLVGSRWTSADAVQAGDTIWALANHEGEMRFVAVRVERVEAWRLRRPRTLWNLSVEEGESYVASGFVVHNCRCCAIPKPVGVKGVKDGGGLLGAVKVPRAAAAPKAPKVKKAPAITPERVDKDFARVLGDADRVGKRVVKIEGMGDRIRNQLQAKREAVFARLQQHPDKKPYLVKEIMEGKAAADAAYPEMGALHALKQKWVDKYYQVSAREPVRPCVCA
jgi:hypothetical protein